MMELKITTQPPSNSTFCPQNVTKLIFGKYNNFVVLPMIICFSNLIGLPYKIC